MKRLNVVSKHFKKNDHIPFGRFYPKEKDHVTDVFKNAKSLTPFSGGQLASVRALDPVFALPANGKSNYLGQSILRRGHFRAQSIPANEPESGLPMLPLMNGFGDPTQRRWRLRRVAHCPGGG